MKLSLVRNGATGTSTTGELSINGRFECFTLEDMVREVPGKPVSAWKVPGKTAIPCGLYEVTMNYSEHFGTILPLLLNVPGYEGVRIHAGNTAADTEGCILVGQMRNADVIGRSRAALAKLLPQIQTALNRKERVFIEITKGNARA